MSKSTFDYALIDESGNTLSGNQVVNYQKPIEEWIAGLEKEYGDLWSSTLVCLEHTGFYSAPLLNVLNQKAKANIWLEGALQIKRSSGLQRGKSDPIDALKIATYALDFRRKAILWKPLKPSISRLALLVGHRDRLVKTLMSITNPLEEEKAFIDPQFHEEMQMISQPSIEAMKLAIAQFDERIKALIDGDLEIARQAAIITSIPGFGQVIASKLILVTKGFTRINTARKLSCFAGMAPFPFQSGTSIRGKTRVSHLANKEIKKMLHLAALVTIRKGNIMHQYFQRKVALGKNKMSVINAIRNKLLHILMACINNDTTYQKKYQHSLA